MDVEGPLTKAFAVFFTLCFGIFIFHSIICFGGCHQRSIFSSGFGIFAYFPRLFLCGKQKRDLK